MFIEPRRTVDRVRSTSNLPRRRTSHEHHHASVPTAPADRDRRAARGPTRCSSPSSPSSLGVSGAPGSALRPVRRAVGPRADHHHPRLRRLRRSPPSARCWSPARRRTGSAASRSWSARRSGMLVGLVVFMTADRVAGPVRRPVHPRRLRGHRRRRRQRRAARPAPGARRPDRPHHRDHVQRRHRGDDPQRRPARPVRAAPVRDAVRRSSARGRPRAAPRRAGDDRAARRPRGTQPFRHRPALACRRTCAPTSGSPSSA